MKLLRFLFAGICILMASGTNAQRMYMKVMDPVHIEGESFVTQFSKWTELAAFNGGSEAEPPAAFGGAPGELSTKCFTISMRQDKSGYYLKKKMYARSTLASIQIDVTKNTGSANPETFYRLLMENVYVTSIEEAVDEDGSTTMNVSFVPRRFRYTYWPQLNNGTLGTPVQFGWDNSTNKEW